MNQPTDARVATSVDEGTTLVDLLIVVLENLKLLIVLPLAAGLLALAITFLIKPTYTARAVFLPPQQQQTSAAAAMQQIGALAGLAGAASGIKNPADQYVGLMQSATIANRIIDRFLLLKVYETPSLETARAILGDRVNIVAGKKDGLISVEVDDQDPKRAAGIANAYIAELAHMSTQLALTEAQQRRAFFQKQVDEAKVRLTEAQNTLQNSGFTANTLRVDLKSAAEAYASIRAQVTAAEVRLGTLRGQVTDLAPEFKQASASLSALRAELRKLESVDPDTAQDTYVAKYRDFRYQETLFELFVRQLEMAKLDEAREGMLIQVVDAATSPEFKSKPKRTLVAITTSLIVGVLTLMFVLLRRAWRTHLNSPGNASKALSLRSAWRQI